MLVFIGLLSTAVSIIGFIGFLSHRHRQTHCPGCEHHYRQHYSPNLGDAPRCHAPVWHIDRFTICGCRMRYP